VLSGNSLFGTTAGGGSLAGGVVYTLSTDGKGYTNLFNFQKPLGQGQTSTNATGGEPYASLLLLGNTLYGTTLYGGTNGNGVIFAINTDGSEFTNLHTFAAGTTGSTNSDGASPNCQLLLLGGTLYGTAPGGGPFGHGTIFSINTNGTGFALVYTFPDIPNPTNYLDLGGVGPEGALVFADGTLYGTTALGGGYDGNVYALNLSASPSVSLSAQLIAGNLLLSWTNSAFSLQASPGLNGSFTNVPNATSPYTVPAIATEQFFRLQSD